MPRPLKLLSHRPLSTYLPSHVEPASSYFLVGILIVSRPTLTNSWWKFRRKLHPSPSLVPVLDRSGYLSFPFPHISSSSSLSLSSCQQKERIDHHKQDCRSFSAASSPVIMSKANGKEAAFEFIETPKAPAPTFEKFEECGVSTTSVSSRLPSSDPIDLSDHVTNRRRLPHSPLPSRMPRCRLRALVPIPSPTNSSSPSLEVFLYTSRGRSAVVGRRPSSLPSSPPSPSSAPSGSSRPPSPPARMKRLDCPAARSSTT